MKTKEELKEFLPLMQAYVEGKIIQIKDAITGRWSDLENPTFDCKREEYRIKPTEYYRPYETLKEFDQAFILHGRFIQFSETVMCAPQTVCILDGELIVECSVPAYNSVKASKLLNYKWIDGTPCGVKINGNV